MNERTKITSDAIPVLKTQNVRYMVNLDGDSLHLHIGDQDKRWIVEMIQHVEDQVVLCYRYVYEKRSDAFKAFFGQIAIDNDDESGEFDGLMTIPETYLEYIIKHY